MSNHRLPERGEWADIDSSQASGEAADGASENPAPGPSAQPTGNDAVPDGTRVNGQDIKLTPGLRGLIDKIRTGQCILFLGAGVHAAPASNPTQYPEEERPLLGGGLAEALATESAFRPALPRRFRFLRVSLHIDTEKYLGRAKLVDYLKGHLYAGRKPSKALRMLSALPFRIIALTPPTTTHCWRRRCVSEKKIQRSPSTSGAGAHRPRMPELNRARKNRLSSKCTVIWVLRPRLSSPMRTTFGSLNSG